MLHFVPALDCCGIGITEDKAVWLGLSRGRDYGENIPFGVSRLSLSLASMTESTCKPTPFGAFPHVSKSTVEL